MDLRQIGYELVYKAKQGISVPGIVNMLLDQVAEKYDGRQILLRATEAPDYYTGNRTEQQNRYYWGVVMPIVAKCLIESGYDLGIMKQVQVLKAHKKMKERFIGVQAEDFVVLGSISYFLDENLEEPSTASLNWRKFQDYIESICRWVATEFSVAIPGPNEPKPVIV